MPEIRTRLSSPDFWLNFKLGSLDDSDRLLFRFLVEYADDFGRFELDFNVMRGLFWMHQPGRSTDDLRAAFDRLLCACSYLYRYSVGNVEYCEFTNWFNYQRLQYPKNSKIPDRNGILPDVPSRKKGKHNDSSGSIMNPKEASESITSRARADVVVHDVVHRESKEESLAVSTASSESVSDSKPTKTRKRPSYTAEFEQAWAAYARHDEKPKAFSEWKAIDADKQPAALRAIERISRSREAQYCPYLHRFLRNGWEEWVDSDPTPEKRGTRSNGATEHDWREGAL